MVSASLLLLSHPYEKQTVICQCLFITREGHVILSGLGWQLLGRSRQDSQGGHAQTHTSWQIQWQSRTHKQLFMHAWSRTHLSAPFSLTVDNPDGILVTAVTREREAAPSPNSRLCKAADIQLCVFCVVNQPQELLGRTKARHSTQPKDRVS